MRENSHSNILHPWIFSVLAYVISKFLFDKFQDASICANIATKHATYMLNQHL